MPLTPKNTMVASAAALVIVAGLSTAGAQEASEASAAAAPAAAEETPRDPDAVVARVGNETVTEGELALAEEAFEAELANVPEDERRSALIDAMVNMELLAQGARDAGLDQGPEYADRLEFLRVQALRNAYVEQTIVDGLTDEEIAEGYQTLVVDRHTPEPEVRARHILVDTKEEAEKLIAELKEGADFAELAKQSKDPSGQNGGDLGFFGTGQMVPPFEEAAFALEAGELTEEPVESQFGWHIIQVDETRMSMPPSLAEVEGQLRNYLLRQKFESVLAELRDKYVVEIVAPPATEGETPASDTPAPADN